MYRNNVLGYEESLDYDFRTYGNAKAALNIEYHCRFRGPGELVIQTQSLVCDLLRFNNRMEDNTIRDH